MAMNAFEDRVVYLGKDGNTLTQSELRWDCGCVMTVIPPKSDARHGRDMGFSYHHVPCQKHVRTFE